MNSKGRLSVFTKLSYGFGDFGYSAAYTVVAFLFLFYLTDTAHLSPALAGTALLVTKVWDAVIDPFLGHLTDHTVTRWGRRRPYFLFGFVPFGLTFFLLWVIPRGMSQTGMLLYVIVTVILHVTVFSAMSIPYSSLTAELTPDYDERTSLTGYRMAFSIVAGLVAAAAPLAIVQAFGGTAVGYRNMAAIFGLLIAVCPLAVFLGTREPGRPKGAAATGPERVGPRGSAPEEAASFSVLEGVRATLANRPFRLALSVYLFTQMGIDVISATFVYFLKHWMRIEGDSSIILGIIFLVAVATLPFWVWFSNRTSKKLAYAVGLGFLAAVLLGVIALQPGQINAVYALCVLAGIGLGAAHVIPWSIIPDCIEYDELVTGQRREGMFYGFMSFAQQLASSVALFFTGQALSWSGYVGAAATQTPAALWAIRILLGPVPGLMFLAGITSVLLLPISRRDHARIREELERRRLGKEGVLPLDTASEKS